METYRNNDVGPFSMGAEPENQRVCGERQIYGVPGMTAVPAAADGPGNLWNRVAIADLA